MWSPKRPLISKFCFYVCKPFLYFVKNLYNNFAQWVNIEKCNALKIGRTTFNFRCLKTPWICWSRKWWRSTHLFHFSFKLIWNPKHVYSSESLQFSKTDFVLRYILFLKTHYKQWQYAPQVSLLLFISDSPPGSRATHRPFFKESNGSQELLCQCEPWERTVLLAHLTLTMMEWQHCCRSLHINKEANQTEITINAWTLLVILPVGVWPTCSYVVEHLRQGDRYIMIIIVLHKLSQASFIIEVVYIYLEDMIFDLWSIIH